MSENARVVKAAGVVGAATLLSRILGFVRDAVIAWFFGAGFSSDAFIAAFRIPNLLRRLFAEGSLSSAFIPVFTQYMVRRGRSEAFHLARSAFRLLSVFLILVTIGGILLSPWIVKLMAPGFLADKYALTVTLTRLMLPYIFFIGLVALCTGILNALGHFAAPALAPVLLNISIIGSVLIISPSLSVPAVGLAVGVFIGGVLQLALQLPVLWRKGFRLWEKAKLLHPGLRQVATLIPPVIFGGAVYQINIVIGTILGSLLAQGSVTYLYFADRLVQFPLGVFAIAAATAVLPSLSRQAASADFEALKDTFVYALKLVFFISIPSMVGLIVLREPIVALLFQRGEFDAQATRLTAQPLLYYSLGLWAFSAVRIVAATFFAMQDTRTPVKMAGLAILANIILGVTLMQPLEHSGLALATSLASILNLGLLLHALRNKLGALGWRSIARSFCRTLVSSIVMGVAVWAVGLKIVPAQNPTLTSLLGGVVGCMAVGICTYGGVSYVLKSQELHVVLTEVRKGIGGK
ncbi:MAG: murein biosynthesis integral membrane protein MurJ [Desulfobacteraceae bacterium]|jgi:putative peptidoglycan lipid II flippase|nr:murein biosynthesis integral membrane protein MurJ [Desulfobacteraceae bacterium]